MLNKPSWLPDLLNTNGDFSDILKKLYQVFERDFKQRPCFFQKIRVQWDNRPDANGYDVAFWHLIERENKTLQERQFDPRRAERLSWCRAVIDHYTEPEVIFWEYKNPQKGTECYFWLRDWDYVVILRINERKGNKVCFLITAYHIDGERTRKQLQRKYDHRVRG